MLQARLTSQPRSNSCNELTEVVAQGGDLNAEGVTVGYVFRLIELELLQKLRGEVASPAGANRTKT